MMPAALGLGRPMLTMQARQARPGPSGKTRALARPALHRLSPHQSARVLSRNPPRLTVCKGGSRQGEAETNGTEANGAGAGAAPRPPHPAEGEVSDEEVENNPELHPLKEALQRARLRLEEATGIREALEAEAQKVAQLAVNAEGAVSKARRQLDEVQADLEAAQATRAKAAAAVDELQQLMAAKAAEAAQGLDVAEERDFAGAPPAAEEPALGASEAAERAAAIPSLEDSLWQRSQDLQATDTRIAEVEAKVAALQAKLLGAEEAYRQADGIAQAAMEAAEEAVRDEMETIAVFKETENALLKAIEDLRHLDDTSGRQEEEWDRKVVLKTVDADDSAAQSAAAQSAAVEAVRSISASKSLDLRPYEEVKQEQAAAARKGWRGLLAAAQQHKALLLGLLVVALAGGAFLHQ